MSEEKALNKVTQAQARWLADQKPAFMDKVIKAEEEARAEGATDADIIKAKAKAEKGDRTMEIKKAGEKKWQVVDGDIVLGTYKTKKEAQAKLDAEAAKVEEAAKKAKAPKPITAKADKKADKAKKQKKEKKEKKPPVALSAFGHRAEAMSGAIDAAVHRGIARQDLVKLLVKEFGRDERRAASKVKSHLKTLARSGVKVEVSDKDYITAQAG